MKAWNDQNPLAMPAKLWQATFTAPFALAESADWALAESTPALAVEHFLHDEPNGIWRVKAFYDHAPDMAVLTGALAVCEAMFGEVSSAIEVSEVPQKNWVEEVQKNYPPLKIARHFIHGKHVEPPYPLGYKRLQVDAGMAFGTGEHGTTEGCLLALTQLYKQGFKPKRILDMGCGTGLLALAAKQFWPRAYVLGTDIDPIAIKVAKENAAINGLNSVQFLAASGYDCHEVAQGQFDLIIANILARTVMKMATQAKKVMAPNARIILSGLLTEQSNMVQAAHRMQGLYLEDAQYIRGWGALTMR